MRTEKLVTGLRGLGGREEKETTVRKLKREGKGGKRGRRGIFAEQRKVYSFAVFFAASANPTGQEFLSLSRITPTAVLLCLWNKLGRIAIFPFFSFPI